MARFRITPLAFALAAFSTQGVAQSPEQRLPEVRVQGKAEAAPGAREYPDQGYQARGATAGSKVELPLKDVPQSITVINEEALRDLAPARIHQVADYVAGAGVFASAATPYTNAFFLRGFSSTAASTFNGFRDSGFLTTQSLINLKRIEFLKGPASVLYGGSAALSGLVNYVSKRPQDKPMREVTVGAGSFDRYYTTLDATGPLTDDKRLRYRLTAAYDYGGNHRKDYGQDSRFVSPYFSWDLTERTQLDVELIAQHTRFDGRENPLPRHPVSLRLPVETNLGPGGDGEDRRFVARIDLKHRFDNGWTLRQGIYHNDMRKTKDYSFQFLAVNPDGVTGTRRVRSVPEYERDFSSQTELSGTFATGTLKHNLLIGVESASRRFAFDFFVATATGVNLFDPQPGVQTGPLVLSGAPNESGANTTAFYAQDLIDLTHGFKLMLGARFDDVEQFSRPKAGNPAPGNLINRSATSPRAGLIYQPTPATSIYGSWTKSFAPNLGMSATGAGFEPQEGEQVEFGIKHDLRPDLSLTAALFDFRRTNVLTADPANVGFSIAVGEQRSTGFELEAQGRVTRDYSIIAAYTNLDARVSRDNTLRVGDRLAGVPKNAFALFNKLRLTALGVPEWSATLGLVYAGARESGLPNSTAAFSSEQLRLPSYTRVDAGLIYEQGRHTVRLSGTNLTNEKIYDSNGSSIYPRAPQAYAVSLAVKF
jgi:iron complex outermembrane receptor protein